MIGWMRRVLFGRAQRRRELCDTLEGIRVLVHEAVPERERTRAMREYKRSVRDDQARRSR